MTQASKNLLFAAIGLVVAGGLAAYAVFGVMKPEEAEEHHKEVTDRIFSAAADLKKGPDGGTADLKFKTIEVVAKGDDTKLERQGDVWKVVSPVQADADRFALDGLSTQLQTAKFKEKLEEKPTDEDLNKYGLKEPQFKVTGVAEFPDGSEKTIKIEGGIENPFDNSVYLRREGDPAVYTGEGSLRYTLYKSTFDLRSKELVVLEDGKVSKIELKGSNGPVTLQKDGKAWKITAPVALDADTSAVTALIASLRGERAQAFVDDSPAKRKELGLETPKVDVTFTQGDQTTRIRFASGVGDAGVKTYALSERGGSAVIAEVAGTGMTAADKKVDDLKDKSAVKFDANAVAKVTITPANGGTPIVLEKAHGADGGRSDLWEVTAPAKKPAKPFKVSSLLWTVSTLKASAFGEENPKDWGKYGVGDKSMRIEVADESGKLLGTFVRGKDVPGKMGTVYARGARNQVLEIDTARLNDLPVTLADFAEAPAAEGDGGVAGVVAP